MTKPGRLLLVAKVAVLAAALGIPRAWAERIVVAPGDAGLQSQVDAARDGDVLVLQAGRHRGPVHVTKRIVLEGEPGALVEGDGRGNVITLSAPGAVVRGLTIRGSGSDLPAMDSGVFVEKTATGAVVEHNRLEDNLTGVYVHGAANAVVQANIIVGRQEGRVNEAGNGVSLWNSPGAKVLYNDVRFGRDGIYTVTSRNNVFRGNRFRDLRFAVHYMYTNDSEVSENLSLDNTVGFAIMFSNRLVVRGNISDGDRDHGFLFNYANSSEITGNAVLGRLQPAERWLASGTRSRDDAAHRLPADAVATGAPVSGMRTGPGKCVFIYNANRNKFHDNWFENCEIGIHFTAGSEGNEITGNAFAGNRNQVKYVGTRHLDWSKGGRGNYWSDNPAFDLNGDGIADTPYRPNDLIDRVLWTAPPAKILINSPAVQVIRWAQAQFPALLPGGVVDTHPLISPPPRPALDKEGPE